LLAPVGRDEDLARVESLANLHPLVILGIHPPKALQITKSGRDVLSQMARIWRAMLVKVIEEGSVKVFGVRACGGAAEFGIILEEGNVEAEFISGK